MAVGVKEALAEGKSVRGKIPRSSHREWSPGAGRANPVDLIEEQNRARLEFLVPVRRVRMAASPFTFYRGTARVMASDLAAGPDTGLTVQLCGDAHLSNFGVYASPERRLMFDVNDFDETFRGPFEWDVKRLAASLTIAGQDRQFDSETCRRLAVAASEAYRTTMQRFAERDWLDAWYSHVTFQELQALGKTQGASKKRLKRGKKFATKAKSKNHLQAARKLVEPTSDGPRFKSVHPLLIPVREWPLAAEPDRARAVAAADFADYQSTLSDSTRWVLDRYRFVDLAIKVVGVGSVGTRCMLALLVGRNPADVLLLQIKEATQSVLEEHLPAGRYTHSGRRVVEGQRLMQAASDIFLGWSESSDTVGEHYYWRQFKDWKGSADLDRATPKSLVYYGRLCGATLARAHAVSGDPAAIAGYLGKNRNFDRAMGRFAERYAEQNLADYEAFAGAIRDGRLEAAELDT